MHRCISVKRQKILCNIGVLSTCIPYKIYLISPTSFSPAVISTQQMSFLMCLEILRVPKHVRSLNVSRVPAMALEPRGASQGRHGKPVPTAERAWLSMLPKDCNPSFQAQGQKHPETAILNGDRCFAPGCCSRHKAVFLLFLAYFFLLKFYRDQEFDTRLFVD